ncbi:hypothetical protein NE865_03212 [Phthorimaea operculella]|nr:hypothetical protein NE865_03212 [Phthorimaea operculella]
MRFDRSFITFLWLGVAMLFFMITVVYGSKECYQAHTCVHNGNERCGVNSDGKARRFLDSCDIKEFNCLKGTNYEKASMDKCADLPPIPPEKKDSNK